MSEIDAHVAQALDFGDAAVAQVVQVDLHAYRADLANRPDLIALEQAFVIVLLHYSAEGRGRRNQQHAR